MVSNSCRYSNSKIFCEVANYAACFSAVFAKTLMIFPLCGPQCAKMIADVGNSEEKHTLTEKEHFSAL
jgi:hypothetical protein